jgi:hypothetical protein
MSPVRDLTPELSRVIVCPIMAAMLHLDLSFPRCDAWTGIGFAKRNQPILVDVKSR